MNEFLPFIVAGIATGSVYGLAGTGLVLTYKTSGIFNFGHGAIATAAAYVFYTLHVRHAMPWLSAALIAVFAVGPVLGLVMEVVARRLARQPMSSKIVGTVGLVLLVQGLATVADGPDTTLVAQFLPKAQSTFRVAGVDILYPQLWVTLAGLAGVLGLWVLFRRTRTGLAMRAVVDDPDLVAMQGVSPAAVRRTAWIIGTTFASLSGVLVLPFIGLNAISLTFLVVQAFGAAAVGRFSSIPLTYAGGLAIGILASLSTKYVVNVDWLSGLPDSLPFVVLFVALLVTPKRRLVPPSLLERRPRPTYRAPARFRLGTAVLAVALLAVVPAAVGDRLPFYTVALTQMILLLSLGLLVRTSNQISLSHSVFAAIGAVAFSQLSVGAGLPWLLAVLLGALIVVPVGALIAIPAIRLSGLFLALATFGFAILVERLLYARGFMFTTLQNGRAMPRPSFATGDTAYYYVVLAFLVVTGAVMAAVHAARLGRMLRGMADAPVAVSTMGLSTNTTRVIVFCVSAFFAGLAGILYGGSVHYATTVDPNYGSFYSLTLLAVLAIAPGGEPWYALLIGISTVIPAYLTSGNVTYWLNALFGLAAIQVAIQGDHPAMPARLRARLDRFRAPSPPPAAAAVRVREPSERPRADNRGLEVRNLRVRFGGLVAVDDVTFQAPVGRITGLIGPNGAGKTTTFDACCGLNRRIGGSVHLHGEDVTAMGPAARGRRGLGRTFQRMQLGDSLTVFENVALGREAGMAGAGVVGQLVAAPGERARIRAEAMAALDLCGIADLAQRQAGALSTGQRRLVELARAVAGPFDVLLLDEPSSGLDRDETAAFDEVLRRVVAERHRGALLVEHDVSLVLGVCDHIYVLDFGRLLFEGDPAAVASSRLVRDAYLGTMADAEQEAS